MILWCCVVNNFNLLVKCKIYSCTTIVFPFATFSSLSKWRQNLLQITWQHVLLHGQIILPIPSRYRPLNAYRPLLAVLCFCHQTNEIIFWYIQLFTLNLFLYVHWLRWNNAKWVTNWFGSLISENTFCKMWLTQMRYGRPVTVGNMWEKQKTIL